MRSITSTLALVVVATAATVVGCASKASTSTDHEAVAGGTEAASTESDTEAMSSSFISATGSSSGALSLATHSELTGSDIAPQNVGDTAKAFYMPAGCLVVTDDASKGAVTYAFNDCTGPYGLVHLTGSVVVDYSTSTATALVLKFSTTNLQINHSTVTWTATANVTGQGGARDMIWDAQLSGTTGGGRAFTRTNHKEYKWTPGAGCLAVSGSSDGTIIGREIKIDIINYSRCRFACPEAGSEVKVTDVTPNLVYDVKYNANDATYTAPDGHAYDFHPFCAL